MRPFASFVVTAFSSYGTSQPSVKHLSCAHSAKIAVLANVFEGLVYRHLEHRLAQHVRDFLQRANYLRLPQNANEQLRIVVEQPPRIEFGDYALP